MVLLAGGDKNQVNGVRGDMTSRDINDGPVPQERSVQSSESVIVHSGMLGQLALENRILQCDGIGQTGDPYLACTIRITGQVPGKVSIQENQIGPAIVPRGHTAQVVDGDILMRTGDRRVFKIGSRQWPDVGVLPLLVTPAGGGESQLVEAGPSLLP